MFLTAAAAASEASPETTETASDSPDATKPKARLIISPEQKMMINS